MDTQFSWYTIEEEKLPGCKAMRYSLYLNNKKGAHKLEARRDTLDEIEAVKARREALAEAIKWAMDNPEEFKKRMNRD